MNREEIAFIESTANEIRKTTIDTIGYLGVGHIGGALSIVEVLAVLYYREMNVNPVEPRMMTRDRLILSKGHAGPALYSTLALKGFFPVEWLHTLNVGGTRLPSHCDRNLTPGIDMTTGSLGQGISAACGIALASKIDGRENYTFVIVGDGESEEGEVWEAAMFGSHYRLDRLIAFTDNNKMQIDGSTAEISGLDDANGTALGIVNGRVVHDAIRADLVGKWAAFGWNAERVPGHDVGAISDAIERAKHRAEAGSGAPTMITLETVKGKGASFCEGQIGSHNMNVDYETAKKAIAELSSR